MNPILLLLAWIAVKPESKPKSKPPDPRGTWSERTGQVKK